jgi:hypothetical protein
MRIAVKDSSGKTILDFPNNHGPGSVVEMQYVFPSKGTYSIDVIFGQQTPLLFMSSRGEAKYGTGRNKPLTCRRIIWST